MTSRIKLPFKLGDPKKFNEPEINETIKKDDFSFSEIVRYGFPYRPTTLAYDPVQKILAIGTKTGVIKIYGGAFVECSLPHPTEVEIVQLLFRINEGALISACRDNCIHLWSLRQKKPVIANTLRFAKERISRCFLPLAFNSKWLLVGTYNGNVYVVNLDTFTLSSYKIMWNNAIGMGKSTHPGAVIDLAQSPDDPTKLFIGFSTHLTAATNPPLGHVICWNLQQKASEAVYTLPQGLTSLSWHHEGRQFMCSHCDGSLSVWNLRSTDKPVSISYPHARIAKDDCHRFGPINKVIWTTVKTSGEPFIIFSGGMPPQTDQQQPQQPPPSGGPTANATAASTTAPPPKPSSYFLTIWRGQTTNVLHMDNSIIDFHIVNPSPHSADIPDPSAVVVLLENDLVMIDLKTESYPLFESLHTLDLHESPVTFCDYITEPNTNFYQSLLRLQSKQTPKRSYSQQENPISGGKSGSTIFGYNELILTGHADGSIKFWDASGCNLLFLYKLRTNRLFDRIHTTNSSSSSASAHREGASQNKFDTRSNRANSNPADDHLHQQMNNLTLTNEINAHEYPFALYAVKLCCEGKYLAAAARGGHVTLFKFTGSELEKADEGLGDLTCLEIPILHRNVSNDHDDLSSSGNTASSNEGSSRSSSDKKDFKSLLRAKMGYRRMAGYQPDLVCLLSWLPSDKIPVLSDIAINSKYGLLVFGLDNGLVVVDFLSQAILMNMATADLYGTMDPFQRASVSPKRRGPSNDLNNDDSLTPDLQATSTSNHQSTEAGSSPSSSTHLPFSHSGQHASRSHSKSSHTSHPPTVEQVPANFFRSRSIDSVSMETSSTSHGSCGGSGGGTGAGATSQDEKSTGTATLAKTLRTLRKRLSRTSYSLKNDSRTKHSQALHVDKDHVVKDADDETEGSSGAEEISQLTFGAIPAEPEFAPVTSPPVHPVPPLKVNRSLPADHAPRIVTSPPPEDLNDSHEKNNDSTSSNENSSLSKTWSSSTFTGAQLRGTCSLEYAEYMRDKAHRRKAHMIDLRKDEPFTQTFQQKLTGTPSLVTNKSSGGGDLPRSSSNSSMDNIVTNESVCAIQFSESFTYKNDNTVSPSVWLGTSTGCVLVINLNIIYEPRNISVVPSGSVFRLWGRLLHISFLDHKGIILPSPSEKWDTKKLKSNRSNDTFAQPPDLNASTVLPGSGIMSSSGAAALAATVITSSNIQYAVFCSSKQARVVSLPSQVCYAKQKIDESLGASASQFLRAAVVKIAGSACLTCLQTGNRIQVFSLPSLRPLYTVNLETNADSFRFLIASTFTFTNRGHGLFMCSPTEIQKFTLAADVKEQINEMLCELYSPSIIMPDAPRPGFFAKIFSSNAAIDHDQLFGEAAGKAPVGVAKKEDVNVNINQLRGKADSANNVINDTRMKLIERGQKLGEIDIASKQMAERAEEFASLSHKVMLKQKEKAEWSWPFASKKS